MMLSGNRALDVTTHSGWPGGRILADLGVDVIKVEPPGGDPGRSLGPFYKGEVNPERSLSWFAYNLGKRGITLNLEVAEGREIFKRLVKDIDFILESFPPGRMKELGLDYNELREINPKIIFTSISPFGQSGPYRDYKAPDIVTMAMGGFSYVTGDADRPPLRISFPMACAMACAQAVVGSLIAFHHRQNTGVGQYVDVSAQESVVNTLISALPYWELSRILTTRVGPLFFRGGLKGEQAHQRVIWTCQDGAITFMPLGGMVGSRANRALVKWMEEEGMANDFLRSIDWDTFSTPTLTREFNRQFEEVVGGFFKTHTRKELHEGAQQRGIFLQFVATPEDVVGSEQLAARDFWVDVPHPELDEVIRYPGIFAKASESPLQLGSRAPLIGEHNIDIYQDELGLSPEELEDLKRKGII